MYFLHWGLSSFIAVILLLSGSSELRAIDHRILSTNNIYQSTYLASTATQIKLANQTQGQDESQILNVLKVIGGLSSIAIIGGFLLTARKHLKEDPIVFLKRQKRKGKPIKLAIVRNGIALYTDDIRNGIYQTVEYLLRNSKNTLAIKDFVGCPEDSDEGRRHNQAIFNEVVTFRPRYVVTIGTEVSRFGMPICIEQHFPMVAVGVGSPVKCGIIDNKTKKAKDNAQVACVRYGIELTQRIKIINTLFHENTPVNLHFLYNEKYPQDKQASETIAEAFRADGEVHVSCISLTEPLLPQGYDKRGNVFFGFYYLNVHLSKFLSMYRNAAFIGLGPNDAKLGAIASITAEDFSLGALAASRIIVPAIVENRKLKDIALVEPDAFISLNLNAATSRHLQFSESALKSKDTKLIIGS